MSTFLEAWKNRKQIMEGIANNVFKKEHVEEVYTQRKSICDSCEFKDVEGTKCAIPGTQPCCRLCGCSLSIKLRSLNTSCPENRWTAVLSDEEHVALDAKLNPEKYKDETQ